MKESNYFDSNEEYEFDLWLDELAERGYFSYEYHPETITIFPPAKHKFTKVMKTKLKTVEKTILQGLEYTPDFKMRIIYSPLRLYLEHVLGLVPTIEDEARVFYIDTKGTFSKFHDAKYFSAVQKALYHEKGIFVNKIIPNKFWKKTFCPEAIRWMKNRKKPTERKPCIGTDNYKGFLDKVDKWSEEYTKKLWSDKPEFL